MRPSLHAVRLAMDVSDEFRSLDERLQILAIRIAVRQMILSPLQDLFPSDALPKWPDLGTFEETAVQKAVRDARQWLESKGKHRAIEAKPHTPKQPIDYSAITRAVSG